MESPNRHHQLESASLSIFRLPSDVLEHHIYIWLDISSLVVCSLVCCKFQKLSSRRLSKQPENILNQNILLHNIFRSGWANLLSWFQARLRYLSLVNLRERPKLLEKCLILAAEGLLKYFKSQGKPI